MTVIRSLVLVGLFSAKDREYQARLDALEARAMTMGVQVVDRFVQRRGVSDGGVRLMGAPLSRRFLIGPGKLEEIASTCATTNVDAVLFINELSAYQRRWLSARLQRPVLTQADLDHPGRELTCPTRSAPHRDRRRKSGRRR